MNGRFLALMFDLDGAKRFNMNPQNVFPFLTGWLILIIAGRAYNIVSFDSHGFGRYLLAPVSMRQVILVKNLFVALMMFANLAGIAFILNWSNRISLQRLAEVSLGLLFAMLTALAAGNFFSVRFPASVDLEA